MHLDVSSPWGRFNAPEARNQETQVLAPAVPLTCCCMTFSFPDVVGGFWTREEFPASLSPRNPGPTRTPLQTPQSPRFLPRGCGWWEIPCPLAPTKLLCVTLMAHGPLGGGPGHSPCPLGESDAHRPRIHLDLTEGSQGVPMGES